MTELHAEVDVESLVVSYLVWALGELDLEVGVSGRLPSNWTPADTWLRVTLLGSNDRDRGVGHVVAARCQIDAFGDNATELYGLAATALRELRLLPRSGWTYPGAVVTDVSRESGPTNRPDTDSDAEKYELGVVLTLHPVAA